MLKELLIDPAHIKYCIFCFSFDVNALGLFPFQRGLHIFQSLSKKIDFFPLFIDDIFESFDFQRILLKFYEIVFVDFIDVIGALLFEKVYLS